MSDSADATELFGPWEQEITGWDSFLDAVNYISATYPRDSFVWRGQADANWGLKSSLYRVVADHLGQPPTEAELVIAEEELLRRARIDWRLDGIPALQLFAQLQHVGAPTRLLDVTFNPLIAAWFAVAHEAFADWQDGRLFVFVNNGDPLQLNTWWNGNRPRWHYHPSDERHPKNWGTGVGRKIWRPPALHNRIPAQNAAFILDGVPMDSAEMGRVRPGNDRRWQAADLRHHVSVPVRLSVPREGRLPREHAPVFTYRVHARAKSEIRHQLEDHFDLRFPTIYPDIEGFAQFLGRAPWLAHRLGSPASTPSSLTESI